MKRKKIAIALSAALSVSVLAGCGGSDNGSNGGGTTDLSSDVVTTYDATDMSKNPAAATAENRKDTLVIGTIAPDGVFNPLYAESAYDSYPTEVMFAPLMAPQADGSMGPYLAEAQPEVSEDGLTYTYKIKKDAKWSDGTDITAKDVELAVKIACDSSYTGVADYRTGRVKVKGAQEYFEGKADSISGVEVVDDKTVKFTLLEKSSSAEIVLGGTQPVNTAYTSKFYTQGNTDKMKETFTNPGPTSGAYKFKSYKKGEELVLEANDDFFLGKPGIKNIVYKVTTEETKLQMLEAGDIDFVELSVSDDYVKHSQDLGYIGYKLYPTNGYGYICFNHNKPQFQDPAVRKALTVALDRQTITSSIFNQYAEVINVPQTKASWAYYEGDNKYEYNLEEAKKILDEAGWKVGADGIREKDGVKLTINFTGTSDNDVVDSILSVSNDDWKELGVKYTSEKLDFTSMREKQEGNDWDMMFMAWGLTNDPNDMDVYGTNGSQNKVNYSNEKVDKLYEQINKELDKEKAKELYKQLYTELNNDLPYIFVYQRSDMWAYNGRVKGLDISPFVHYSWNLYKATLE